jgi:protein-L-isoaspartate(D-aspartate) O-methyltransferase
MAYKTRIRPIVAILLSMLLVAASQSAHALDDHNPGNQILTAISDHVQPFASIESADLDRLLDRIGDARLVLLGESTHGTQEFYRMRARISKALIEDKGFDVIALEADWPDATSIERYVQSDPRPPLFRQKPFSSFQSWMWRNQPFIDFSKWLKSTNQKRTESDRVHVYGLDLYNMQGSMRLVLNYLRSIDADAADFAWRHYNCLLPVAAEPGRYGHYANTGRHPVCQREAGIVYQLLVDKADQWQALDQDRYFHALTNALLVVNDEYFFRRKYSSDADADRDAWNYREQNMLDNIKRILDHHGPDTKIIVWAHNTHIGDSAATVMADDDRHSLGKRVRQAFPGQSYLVGFGTHTGTVTASPDWNQPSQTMRVPASHERSVGHLLHRAGPDNFMLPLRDIDHEQLDAYLNEKRGQRAIGVSYDPQNEVEKHYLNVRLAQQFDEFIWFDTSTALVQTPLKQPGK